MRILVIDDDYDIRDALGMVLEAEGHAVATACDGVSGLDQLRAGSRPSLIILDMMMPRLDGEGFVEGMRSDPSTAGIPFIILSGHPAARRKATELGAAGCLVKPVELGALLKVVDAIDGSEGPRGPGSAAPPARS